jgi:hypothetical protein
MPERGAMTISDAFVLAICASALADLLWYHRTRSVGLPSPPQKSKALVGLVVSLVGGMLAGLWMGYLGTPSASVYILVFALYATILAYGYLPHRRISR